MSKKSRSRTDCQRSRTDRRSSRRDRLHPLATLVALGLTAPAFAGSSEFPTYHTGPSPAGWPAGSWVVSSGQVITPAGTEVYLGTQLRAKAIAIDPTPGQNAAGVSRRRGISGDLETAPWFNRSMALLNEAGERTAFSPG